jgi:hypothetical protein
MVVAGNLKAEDVEKLLDATPALQQHQKIDVHVSRGPGGSHKSIEEAARINIIGSRPTVKRDTSHDLVLFFDRVLAVGADKNNKKLAIGVSNDDAIRLALELLEGMCPVYTVNFFGKAPRKDEAGNTLDDQQRQAIAHNRIGVYKGLIQWIRKQVDNDDDLAAFDLAAEYNPGY